MALLGKLSEIVEFFETLLASEILKMYGYFFVTKIASYLSLASHFCLHKKKLLEGLTLYK